MLYYFQDPTDQAAGGAASRVQAPAAANALEALLAGGAGNLQALLDMPDADDETMVQLAIALSLQDQVCYYGIFKWFRRLNQVKHFTSGSNMSSVIF